LIASRRCGTHQPRPRFAAKTIERDRFEEHTLEENSVRNGNPMAENTKIRLAIPTGRLQAAVLDLLADAGLKIQPAGSNYRPLARDPRFDIKMLKAANIPSLIELGAHDVGFTGFDWVSESSADVVSVLDTRLLPVRIVAAAPVGFDPFRDVSGRPVVVASEYENLTRGFMAKQGVEYRYVRTFGATEVFPPEDADLIVDNTATGTALRANRLEIIDTLLESTLLCVANRAAMEHKHMRAGIEELSLLMQSVIDARERVLLEMNVGPRRSRCRDQTPARDESAHGATTLWRRVVRGPCCRPPR
jgi:ATP phosphoribosyltransferase